jgi:hypothetical protein
MTFIDYTRATLQTAHRHCSNHRKELERSEICGCFSCCRTFTATAVEEWVDDEDGTAICPYCSVDSVLGSASGYPVSEQHFLRAMHALWFENET